MIEQIHLYIIYDFIIHDIIFLHSLHIIHPSPLRHTTPLSMVSPSFLAQPFHNSSVLVCPSLKLTAILCHFFGPNLGLKNAQWAGRLANAS